MVGKFNAKDVILTTKLKNAVLSPRNTILPNPPPPYDQTSTSLSHTSLSDNSLVQKDTRDETGSEISSCQIYYDAREDSVKRFRGFRSSSGSQSSSVGIVIPNSAEENVKEENQLGKFSFPSRIVNILTYQFFV